MTAPVVVSSSNVSSEQRALLKNKKVNDDIESARKELFSDPADAWLQPLQCSCGPSSWITSCAPKATPEPIVTTEEDGSTTSSKPTSLTQNVQYCVSVLLLSTCVGLCSAGILTQQTPVAISTHPLICLALMWLLILWLGLLEGGQGCLVGLQPVNAELFRTSHPHTFACTQMVSQSKDDLNRFIVGRQFFVVLVVFLLNLCCTALDGTVLPIFPQFLVDGLLTSGLAVMIITVILGQLAAEVNATNCMLDFINNPLCLATTGLCLIIEESGLLHAVYLVNWIFGSESCQDILKKTQSQQVWYWIRVCLSVTMLSGAMVVTCVALWYGETTFYPGLDTVEKFITFAGLICFLGLLEAIQIAVFAVVKLPPQVVAASPAAQANCDMVFSGHNFKATLIGRQICVTTAMFLLARITTTNVDPADLIDTSATDSTVLGVPAALQDFFNTGLPGALITTIVASLFWRIAAASFPLAFMANPIVHWTIRLCLWLEASGVFSAAWLMADGIKYLSGFRTDDNFLNLDTMHNSHSPAKSKPDLESVLSDDTVSTRRSEESFSDYGSCRGEALTTNQQ